MYKYQQLPLTSDCKETLKTLEAAGSKLQSIKLDTPTDSNPRIEKTNLPSKVTATTNQAQATSSQSSKVIETTNQAPAILTISESSVKSKPVSKNNHKTPTLNKVVTKSLSKDLKTSAEDSKRANVSKNSKKNYAPHKVASTGSQSPKTIDPKERDISPQVTAIEKKGPETSKPIKPDPKTTCTCESLQPKEAPAPALVPKRQEPQNVPIYRWISVKSESLKSEAEKMAEIRLLLPKTESPNGPQTTTNRRRKPRLCPFCWDKVLKARRQETEKKERELRLAQQTENKMKSKTKKASPKENSNSIIKNRFGFLDEESA